MEACYCAADCAAGIDGAGEMVGDVTASVMLAIHGTEAPKLPPAAILAAADADVRRAWRNAKLRATRKEYKLQGFDMRGIGVAESYAFAPRDIATTAIAILKNAIASRGMLLAKVSAWEEVQRTLPKEKRYACPCTAETIKLYSDPDLLQAALALAEQRNVA